MTYILFCFRTLKAFCFTMFYRAEKKTHEIMLTEYYGVSSRIGQLPLGLSLLVTYCKGNEKFDI